MSEQKYYVVGTTTAEAWEYVHQVLTQDGSLDNNIPSRPVVCADLKEQSPTRAIYLMTDEEAAQLSSHPNIQFIHLDPAKNPEMFPTQVKDDLHCATRYTSTVKNYRNFSGLLPATPNSTDANRAGYQLYRTSQYANPWQGQSVSTVLNNAITNTNTGRHVDVVVGDEGCWIGHVEFQRNPTGGVELPRGYIGGNVLPGNGTCDVLDMVLDGPYYIDPAWFNASPGTRLITRWDGTIVPTEQAARDWWGNPSQRSSQFASAGTVTVPSYYTRANCNGSNTAKTPSNEGQHGTACAGLTFGRTYGWAYNANKWVIDAYGNYGFWPAIDSYFDVMAIFHANKPINPIYGTRDPTISSNSWGFRATQATSGGFYYFRQGTSGTGGVSFVTKPAFMQYLGSSGDGGRFKGEMVTNSFTTAGDELIAAGVIFVVAAGNSNQKQVSSSSPDFDNYWSPSNATPLTSATHSEFGATCYNTTSRRGFPQQLGKYSSSGNIVYPAINIGALDDDNQPDGKERKVNYSDMGNEIDMYLPADGTLTSNQSYSPQYARYDSYPSSAVQSYDCRFSGTSAACPVATGLIATALETNRSWGWQQVRTWIQGLTEQSATTFYQGPDPSTATTSEWADLNSLMGGVRRVGYNNITSSSNVSVGGTGLTISGSGLRIGL
jgi:hypothetical protein